MTSGLSSVFRSNSAKNSFKDVSLFCNSISLISTSYSISTGATSSSTIVSSSIIIASLFSSDARSSITLYKIINTIVDTTYLRGLLFFLSGLTVGELRTTNGCSNSLLITEDCYSCAAKAFSDSILVVILDKSISKKEVLVVRTVFDVLQLPALLC